MRTVHGSRTRSARNGRNRRGPGDLVGAERAHEQHRRLAETASEELEQGAARVVGPVHVLDQHHQRRHGSGALDDPVDGLEELQLQVVGRLGGLQQVGQQRAERAPPTAGPLDQAIGPVQLLHGTQQAQHRGERQPRLAHRYAQPADDVHPRPAPGKRGRELLDERGLPEPGLPGEQDDPATGAQRDVELVLQRRQLAVAAHEA